MNQREKFVETATSLLESDPKVIVILGDIGVHAFRGAMERWPERCINAGICEQGIVGFAAGLAREGYYPVVSSIDPFIARRAYEFVFLDFGANNLKGCFVTVGHDNDYASLGITHSGIFCDTLMGTVPGMCVFNPSNPEGVESYMRQSHEYKTLSYIRLKA